MTAAAHAVPFHVSLGNKISEQPCNVLSIKRGKRQTNPLHSLLLLPMHLHQSMGLMGCNWCLAFVLCALVSMIKWHQQRCCKSFPSWFAGVQVKRVFQSVKVCSNSVSAVTFWSNLVKKILFVKALVLFVLLIFFFSVEIVLWCRIFAT